MWLSVRTHGCTHKYTQYQIIIITIIQEREAEKNHQDIKLPTFLCERVRDELATIRLLLYYINVYEAYFHHRIVYCFSRLQ